MNRKSSTCMGKASGKPLTEHTSEYEANAGANHVRTKFGNVMNPYRCTQCPYWHLAPPSANNNLKNHFKKTKESRSCFGKASGTKLKEYDSQADAKEAARFVLEKYGNQMVPYQCEDCQFWHLSQAGKHIKDCKLTRESQCCVGKVSEKILKEYDNQRDAKEGANFVLENYGNNMIPYKCQDCMYWHLSPADRQTEHSLVSCSCVDEHGASKDGYQSKEDAKRRAEILLKESGRKLNIYRCPKFYSVWHLTKKEARKFVGKKSRTCQNKNGDYSMEYESRVDASVHAAEILEQYGKEVSPYECSECFKWHVG